MSSVSRTASQQQLGDAPQTLHLASLESRVLAVHAPYPGAVQFTSQPGSLLGALRVLAEELAEQGRLSELGLHDSQASSTHEFYSTLERILETGAVRVVCISTSTAAIGEARQIARLAKRICRTEPLVLLGGPHEDAVQSGAAFNIPEVDVSVQGDAASVLAALALGFLDSSAAGGVKAYLSRALGEIQATAHEGFASLSCREWGSGARQVGMQVENSDRLLERPWSPEKVMFGVFENPETLPLMLSRGCSYGLCTFCSEAREGAGKQRVASNLSKVVELAERHPGASLYFQDSIFPSTQAVREQLLPELAALGREWGCQVYLPTLSQRFLEELQAAGCTYLYTGLESGSSAVTAGVGKPKLTRELAKERLLWLQGTDIKVGVSLMFGCMNEQGQLLDTPSSVAETVAFAGELADSGIKLAGFYPNIQTVLPGTALAAGLHRNGVELDFYEMPRCEPFDRFEDGYIGYNFLSLERPGSRALVEHILAAREQVACVQVS